MLTCRILRGAIAASGGLLLTAWLLSHATGLTGLPLVLVAYLGLGLALGAAGVLVVTLILSRFPAATGHLRGCHH